MQNGLFCIQQPPKNSSRMQKPIICIRELLLYHYLPENKFDRAVVGAKDFIVDIGRDYA